MKLLLILIFATCSFASEKSEIRLKNSNKITVSGLKLEKDKITARYFGGKLQIPWTEIQELSLTDTHVVYLKDKTRLVGLTNPGLKLDGFLNLKLQDGKVLRLKKDQIHKIKTMTFWKEEERLKEQQKLIMSRQTWDGSADLGFNLQSGNTEDTQLNFAIKTKRSSEFDVFHINVFANQGESNGTENSNSAKIQTRFDLKNKKNRYYFLLSSLEYDKIKKIDLRSVLGLGLGWTYYDTPKKKLNMSIGLTTDKETRDNGTKKSLVTALVSSEFRFPFMGSNHIEGAINIYPDIKEIGDNLKADSTLSFVTPVTDDTNLKLSLNHRYQQTVLPGVEKLDTLLTTSLSYKF